ncbi:Uma2 family endonuclease [Streptomyces sp. NPDC048420]|uniref:Uma2 family endonuclease n=1 Tax=Streptomyces sp. NPDC048420 TaxID=3155755 RepID=UPI00341C79ED
MVVEVTARDPDTDWFMRMVKPDGYAAAGIPVYLLIDRDDCSVVVYNQPEDGRYRHEEKLPFGATVGVRGLIRDPKGLCRRLSPRPSGQMTTPAAPQRCHLLTTR